MEYEDIPDKTLETLREEQPEDVGDVEDLIEDMGVLRDASLGAAYVHVCCDLMLDSEITLKKYIEMIDLLEGTAYDEAMVQL